MCNRRKPEINAELLMHCYAKGNPKPKLEWYFNGHLVEESKRVSSVRLKVRMKVNVNPFESNLPQF